MAAGDLDRVAVRDAGAPTLGVGVIIDLPKDE